MPKATKVSVFPKPVVYPPLDAAAKTLVNETVSPFSDLDGLESAWDMADHLRLVVYGKSGTGKTTFWASFPKPILCLICSGEDQPEELRSINTPEMRKVVDARKIKASSDCEKALANAKGKYATVVLDHITGLQSLMVKELLGVARLPGIIGWGLMTMQQWGIVGSQSIDILRQLMELDCHCVIAAQERHDNPKEGSEVSSPFVGPAVSPATNNFMLPAVSYTVQTVVVPKVETYPVKLDDGSEMLMQRRLPGVDHCLRTGKHDIITTKFRLAMGQPPEFLPVPRGEGYARVKALIDGQHDETKGGG